MFVLEVIAWTAFATALICGIYWSIVVGRVIRTMRRVTHVRDGGVIAAPECGRPSVSVVVPIHNEERVIDRCLTSLRSQDHPNLQFVLVLDRCTDRTSAIVRTHADADQRIVVVENDDCPADWAGKCNAARVGAAHATGEWILFTDADVRLDATLIRSAQAIALRDDVALLSLVGQLTSQRRFERLFQPAASLTLMRMFPLERVSHPRTPRAFANGQFLLFRRRDYDEVGGHHAVRDDLLEDLAFARIIQRSGRRLAVLFADEMLEVSMYDTLAAFRIGWRRIFIESCVRNIRRLRWNAFRIAAHGVLPPLLYIAVLLWAAIDWLFLGTIPVPLAIAAATVPVAAAIQAIALTIIYKRMGVDARWIVGYPVAALIIAIECLRGADDLAHRRPIRWGGREYVIEPMV